VGHEGTTCKARARAFPFCPLHAAHVYLSRGVKARVGLDWSGDDANWGRQVLASHPTHAYIFAHCGVHCPNPRTLMAQHEGSR
jgi:hypothetical protein